MPLCARTGFLSASRFFRRFGFGMASATSDTQYHSLPGGAEEPKCYKRRSACFCSGGLLVLLLLGAALAVLHFVLKPDWSEIFVTGDHHDLADTPKKDKGHDKGPVIYPTLQGTQGNKSLPLLKFYTVNDKQLGQGGLSVSQVESSEGGGVQFYGVAVSTPTGKGGFASMRADLKGIPDQVVGVSLTTQGGDGRDYVVTLTQNVKGHPGPATGPRTYVTQIKTDAKGRLSSHCQFFESLTPVSRPDDQGANFTGVQMKFSTQYATSIGLLFNIDTARNGRSSDAVDWPFSVRLLRLDWLADRNWALQSCFSPEGLRASGYKLDPPADVRSGLRSSRRGSDGNTSNLPLNTWRPPQAAAPPTEPSKQKSYSRSSRATYQTQATPATQVVQTEQTGAAAPRNEVSDPRQKDDANPRGEDFRFWNGQGRMTLIHGVRIFASGMGR
eukprot:g1815.t1